MTAGTTITLAVPMSSALCFCLPNSWIPIPLSAPKSLLADQLLKLLKSNMMSCGHPLKTFRAFQAAHLWSQFDVIPHYLQVKQGGCDLPAAARQDQIPGMHWQQLDLNPYHPSEHWTLIWLVFIVPLLEAEQTNSSSRARQWNLASSC